MTKSPRAVVHVEGSRPPADEAALMILMSNKNRSVGSSTEADTTSRTASSTEHEDSEPTNIQSAVSKKGSDEAGARMEAPLLSAGAAEHPIVGSIRLQQGFAADDEDSDLTFGEDKVPKNVEGTHSCGSSLTDDHDDELEEQEDADRAGEQNLAAELSAALSMQPGTTKEVEEVLEIQAPAGMLGIVIDTPPDIQAPIIHTVKESSILSGFVLEGDQLIAIDDDDVRGMSATDVSALIANRSNNPTRKLTIVRIRAVPEEQEVGSEVSAAPQAKDEEVDEFSPLCNQDRLLLDAALALTKEGNRDDELILCALSQSLSALSTSMAEDGADSRQAAVSPTRSVKSIGSTEDIVLCISELPYMDSPLEPLEGLEPVQEGDEQSEALLEVLSTETSPLDGASNESKPQVGAAEPNEPMEEDATYEFSRKKLDKLPSFIHISLTEPSPDEIVNNDGVDKDKERKRRRHKRKKKRKFPKERIEL
jgi:hypothetical protein